MGIPINPADLGSIYSMNPGAFQQAQGQIGLGMQQQQTAQDTSLEDLFHKQQMNPLMRQNQVNINDRQMAELPGVRATSAKLQRDQAVREGIPLSVEQQAKLSEITAKMTKDDWEAEEAAIQKAIVSGQVSPENGKKMYRMFKEFQLEAQRADERKEMMLALERLKGENSANVANIRSQGAAAVAARKAADSKLKMSPQQAIIYYRDLRAKAKTQEEADMYEQLELGALRDAYALQQLKPTAPGAIDPAATTDLPKAEPVPAPPVAPLNKGGAKPAMSFTTVAEAEKAISEGKLKKGDKIIVNGKSATVQ